MLPAVGDCRYVRMYRHEATEARIIKEARALGRALEHAGHDYEVSQPEAPAGATVHVQ